MWKDQFLKRFVHCLCHDPSSLVRSNARNHWLNPTFVYLPPAAGQDLLDSLDDCDQCWKARFLVYKGQRLNGQLESLTKDHLDMLETGVQHSSSDVRIAAFAVLCHVKRKGSAPDVTELELVLKFLKYNLAVDEPSFRQVLISRRLNVVHSYKTV